MMQIDPIKICTATIIEAFPDAAGIWLFGSAASGLDTVSSDVDLAILCDSKHERLVLWQCAQAIAAKLGREVDLIDLLDASTVLRAQILQEGRRIYCVDRFRCDLFETEALADYLRFQDERHELLADIKARGKVLPNG